MNNVKYETRGKTTDIFVGEVFKGSVIKCDNGKFCTSHKSDKVESKTFEAHQEHFAKYYVEKN